jgi:hypothetical protein
MVKLEKRYETVSTERARVGKDFETKLSTLRARLEAARDNHLGGDIRDVANEGVVALTSLAEFIAVQHVDLVKKRGMAADVREQWLTFVHDQMQLLYAQCAGAVLDTSALLPGKRERVSKASLDFLDGQSRTYIAALEKKLAVESEPADARSFSERLMAVIGGHTGRPWGNAYSKCLSADYQRPLERRPVSLPPRN